MANFNTPRYQRWLAQQQTSFTAFNNTSGTWTSTGSKLLRVDQGSITVNRNAPYSRFPVLTGNRSEVAGIRGRKAASWEIRGMPLIPSGVAGTVPDSDPVWQCAFGQAATVVASTSATYSFNDTGYLPFSLFGFTHGSTSLTSRALWGCVVTRVTFNFNGPFLTADLQGAGGYLIDNVGFSAFDAQAQAGLTAFPTEPSLPTVNGQPIAGFGNGYTATVDTQNLSLKVRVASISWETGLMIVGDTYGSPYGVAVVGDTRRVSIALTMLDDDSAALNDIKTKADTDNTTINATIVAGTVAGSIVTFNVNNIQPNAFDLKDNGAMVNCELPTSYAHATSAATIDDMTLAFT